MTIANDNNTEDKSSLLSSLLKSDNNMRNKIIIVGPKYKSLEKLCINEVGCAILYCLA
jgi:hypothetical protein